ncbi:MAG: N-acetylmuramoyl-L-alanine amidase [Rhodothermia bacterium]|nr:N-acetylmuramoyl-L-alanine amidase [Rhodothermia bacterium]
MTDARVRMGPSLILDLGKRDRYQASSEDLSLEYTGVVFSGRTDAGLVEAWVRFRLGQSWTEWEAMYIVRSTVDETVMGGFRGAEVRSAPFEMRFEVDSDRRFELLAAGVFDSRKDVGADPQHRVSPSPPRARKEQFLTPDLITREEWNADPFIGQPSPLANPAYEHMTFHHAAGFRATTRAEGLAQVKAIQDLHQNVRGWSDIGYQFVIDRGGRLYQGRPFLDSSTTLEEIPRLALGAHVGGANTGNIGICLLGCYHPAAGSSCTDEITTAAYDTYVETFAFLSENYGVDPGQIRGHRDFSATACPGDNNYRLLPNLIADVEAFIPDETPTPDRLTLAQSYPNPVAGETTIRYYLVEDGVATLKVYDAVGREVAIVVDEFQTAESWYGVDFNAGSLSAGMYFYRIEVAGVGNRTSSRSGTMTVVR